MRPANRWLVETGGTRGPQYAAQFDRLAAGGVDVHGEAAFVDALLAPASRVVDAGCGTGRVAVELARRGHTALGVDLDPSMLAEAQRAAPLLTWLEADLLDVTGADVGAPVDLVVLAGNVVVYLTDGTGGEVVRHLAGWLRPGGLLVAGFATDRHVPVATYRGWCSAAGLRGVSEHAGWDGGSPVCGDGGADGAYAVLVHRR